MKKWRGYCTEGRVSEDREHEALARDGSDGIETILPMYQYGFPQFPHLR